VLSTQLAFLEHDLGHKRVTRTWRTSYLLGLLHGNLVVGLSMGWWLDKDNRPHAHPHHAELDPDVAPAGPLIHSPSKEPAAEDWATGRPATRRSSSSPSPCWRG
jgi:hypothetical protein